MAEITTIKTTAVIYPIAHKKGAKYARFFRLFGHDARQDWLLLLFISSSIFVVFLVFAIWMYFRVHSEKVFTFETEIAPLSSITVDVEALKQTIELFEQKKVKFNSIRQIGVDASDPSL